MQVCGTAAGINKKHCTSAASDGKRALCVSLELDDYVIDVFDLAVEFNVVARFSASQMLPEKMRADDSTTDSSSESSVSAK